MERIEIARTVLADMVEHAVAERPNECCGLLVGPCGLPRALPTRVSENVRCRNSLASPVRYEIDPADHFSALRRYRGSDRAIVGAYHSHPASAAVPSERDRRQAYYPEFVWLIVSLEDPARQDVRAYRWYDGNFVPLRIVPVP